MNEGVSGKDGYIWSGESFFSCSFSGREEWTTSKFIPYGDPDAPVKTGSEEVLASTYMKQDEKQALVVVSNWKYAKTEASLTFNFEKFGFGKNLILKDAFSGKVLPLNRGILRLNMPERDFKIIIVNSR